MIYEHITTKEPIHKGWSGDLKYHAQDDMGNTYLLRISPVERYEEKVTQFRSMERIAALGIPMCDPIEVGTCHEGVYTILRWINGSDAEEVMNSFSAERQYAYGMDAGKFLQKIHSIPAPEDVEPWSVRFNRKIDRKIAMYQACPMKYEGGEAFLEHIARSRYLLSDRPQAYQHGDYHIGNMMVDESGVLTIIDFERDDYGDPWEEFNRIVWCAQKAPCFAAGMVDGYFDGEVPMEFWELLALYICSNCLSSLPWAVSFGEKEIRTMRNQAREVLEWYDNMRSAIPSWYRRP